MIPSLPTFRLAQVEQPLVEAVAKPVVGGLENFKTHRKDAKSAKFRKAMMQALEALFQNGLAKITIIFNGQGQNT